MNLGKYRNNLRKKWFDHQVREILNVPPCSGPIRKSISILSQLHPPDLIMYLLAVKSFTRFLRPESYYIVDDGLSQDDHKLIRQHLENVHFIPIKSVVLGSCPQGGCWERLASIAALSENSFIIQLDADTLTKKRPDEVLRAIADNRSFTLGTWIGRDVIPAQEAAAFAETIDGQHIQLTAERALKEYSKSNEVFYIRGCAGFAGFAPGSVNIDTLSKFSDKMANLVGESRWREWGSEQFASNFLIANSKNPCVLSFEDYPYMNETTDIASSKFVHFVGAHRFKKGTYARLGRSVIGELCSK